MVLHGLHQNCQHYPAQWTGTDNDGREVIVSAQFGCCEVAAYLYPTDPYPEQEWDWDHDEWEGDPCPPWHEVAKVAGLIAVDGAA